MKRIHIELGLWLFCVIAMAVLVGKLNYEASLYSCDYCMAEFTTQQVAWDDDLRVLKIPMQELFNEWKEGRCLVRWDKNTGFQSSYGLSNFSG